MNTDPLPPSPSPLPTTLLQLLWLASPALPVGGFSYSEGLESAIDADAVHDEPSTQAWLIDQLQLGLGRCDLPLLAQSISAWAARPAPDDPRIATLAALAPAPAWPITFALAAAQSGAAAQDTLLAFGFGWAENMVQAALKSVPLGQSAGQRVLGALASALPAVVEAALAMRDDDRQTFTPMLAIHSSRHETQYSRLFRS